MEPTDPIAEVARQIKAYERAKARAASIVTEAKDARDSAIREASRAGVRQVDLVRETGLTRESIRRIVMGFSSQQ